jgi:hypothetical protein
MEGNNVHGFGQPIMERACALVKWDGCRGSSLRCMGAHHGKKNLGCCPSLHGFGTVQVWKEIHASRFYCPSRVLLRSSVLTLSILVHCQVMKKTCVFIVFLVPQVWKITENHAQQLVCVERRVSLWCCCRSVLHACPLLERKSECCPGLAK